MIVGRGDWLFFAETLDDFMQWRVLSEEELVRIRKILTLVDEYVAYKGGRFLFFVAPNKNTVYPEYMPYYYPKGTESSNLEQLSRVLEESSFYLDVSEVLKEKKASWQQEASISNHPQWLYYQRDSHWNDYGAAVVFESIMDWLESVNGNYGEKPLGQMQSHVDWLSQDYQMTMDRVGDLEQMLFPKGGRLDWQVSWVNPPEFSYASSFHSPEDLLIQTVNDQKEGRLLMFRDSCGNALYSFLAGEYEYAEFSRIVPYRLFLLEENSCDTVIIELVERNLSTLLTAAPMFFAPRRPQIEAVECEDAIMHLREVSGMLHVYGTMDFSCSGSIFIAAAKDGVTAYYEAQGGAVNIEAPTVSEKDQDQESLPRTEGGDSGEDENVLAQDSGIFTASGQEFYLGMVVEEEMLAALGTPGDVMEAPSCHFDGSDTIYVYDSFSLYTYLNGSDNILYLIELTREQASTALGARTGMTRTEVEALYGRAIEGEGAYLAYLLSDTTVLQIGFDGDVVSWFEYVEAE